MIKIYLKFKNIFNYFYNKLRSNKNVFSRIYKEKIWGNTNNVFDSGSDSNDEYTHDYIKIIDEFILTNNIQSIVDIGVGDFRVAKKIINNNPDIKFIGIDVVSELIEYLKKNYSSENVSFIKLDATKEQIPKVDLYLIRQVLQHLSNKEVKKLINNIPINAKIIVTEHQFKDISQSIIPNKDQVHGSGTRVENNSGLYLDLHPFNFRLKLLLEVELNDHECLRTFELIR